MLRPRTRTMRERRQPESARPAGAVRPEDGIDDLDVRRVGQGLRTVLMSLVAQ